MSMPTWKARRKGLSLVAICAMLSTFPVPVVGAADKDGAYAELAKLGAQIESLKGNPGTALNREVLLNQYRALSAQMGGDDPAGLIGGQGAPAQAAHGPQGLGTTPTGCTTANPSFTQATPTAIPTGPAVVTSTLVVSGAGSYLLDLDLVTNLTHTFAADLDITLQSPAGTVVTLTTDNGAGNDNVFNGTTWDGDANPAGQVPYVTNNGLATDHAYVNLTTATPLAAEESLGAFTGEDPNGTWTITISDDLAGDGGSLDSWTLNLSTLGGAPATSTATFTQATSTPIPTGPAVVTSTLVVPAGSGGMFDLNLTTNLTHTFAADLDITLQSPAGTVVTLTTDNGAGNDNVFNGTVWDDDANPAGQVPYTTNAGLVTDHPYVNLTTATPLVPEEGMSAFVGEDPAGTWTITISDDLAGDGGSLDSWSLEITTGTCFIRGDFNSDGKTDILWRHSNSGENVLWYMNGVTLDSGEFLTPASLPDTRWQMVGTHDFNADSKNDILWRHDNSGENVVWFMNGSVLDSGTFLTPAALADTNWKMAGTGDFDQDGEPDIAWHHLTAGQIVVWFMNGIVLDSGTFTTPSSFDLNYRLVGVADFSEPQDGRPDFVWRHQTTGDNLIWLMNGTTQTASVGTLALTDTRWELVATGDYNQDFKNDFMWRHQTSGENVAWFMNGPVFVSGTFTNPSSFPDVRWKMVGPR
jgi:subtilisin-like proprotein convertase family protein